MAKPAEEIKILFLGELQTLYENVIPFVAVY